MKTGNRAVTGTVLLTTSPFTDILSSGKGDDSMPGAARQKSESGYCHVILRGIGKQILFEDGEDNT